MKAIDAIAFLPDYLMDEAMSDYGETILQDNYEFKPSSLYME
jgi:hypothetical protein